MQDLRDMIIQSIQAGGPISFRDFMQTALYCPGLGYYTSSEKKIGTDGDYLTSPALSSLFAECISKQIAEMWQLMGKKKFTIVEYGGGNGDLCSEVLENLRHCPALYDSLDYLIVEKNDRTADHQQYFSHPRVRWLNTISGISEVSGCILSNELIDNFPVHVVVMEEELMEEFIGYDAGVFYEILRPASEELKNYFARLHIVLPKGYRTEVNLQALEWLKEIATVLKEGFVITIDYGSVSDELYTPQKKCGSLLCYRKHQVSTDPFKHIGRQDITAQVNFSALRLWGRDHQLDYCGYTSQSQFLRSFGIISTLRKMESEKKPDLQQILKLKTLVFDMGQKIKLMILQKGLKKMSLTGVQFQLPI